MEMIFLNGTTGKILKGEIRSIMTLRSAKRNVVITMSVLDLFISKVDQITVVDIGRKGGLTTQTRGIGAATKRYKVMTYKTIE